MARKAREKSSTGNYAVTLKGIEEIFKSKKVKDTFKECAEKYLGEGLKGIRFSNGQADMLIHESEKGISMDMKPLMTSFARIYNRENSNDGKVFADRFKSVAVETDEDYELCLKYINGSNAQSPFTGGKKADSPVKSAVKKKTAAKPASEKKADTKPVAEIAAEKKEETTQAKPKKNDLPVWLL